LDRALEFSVTALPGLPKSLRSPFAKEGSSGADVTYRGVCETVPVRRVWVALFEADDSSEFRNAAGSVCEPDGAEECAAGGFAWA
jgi:hypothetical protein